MFTVIAIQLVAQTPKAKVDTAKKSNKIPYVVPQGNMPMRVIIPKYTGPMPVAKPDSNKAVNKSKGTKKTK